MTPIAIPEAHEAQEILERAMKLSPAARESLALDLFESVESPPGHSGDDRAYWKVELVRRIEAVRNGTTAIYSFDETMAYLDQVADEGASR